jgi:hypothetical protein
MSWVITPQQRIPAVIGEPFGGGYFAGYISHTADGNPTHALIVAPRATGATGTGYTLTTMLQWKTANTTTAGTTSTFDGAANTAAMVAAGINDHPAAKFCTELTIGGFTDWYLPSLLELDIAYFNLKPSTAANSTSWGINDYSVPKRLAVYDSSYPTQTGVSSFRSTGSEPFVGTGNQFLGHWTSTEINATTSWGFAFENSTRYSSYLNTKVSTSTYRVRAFRRIAL